MVKSIKKHLITGGAGFLGSHLIDRLMDKEDIVICIDNFQTGSIRNISKWINHNRFKLISHDITEPLNAEIDHIWHLACPASPIHYQNNPIKTSKTNFVGTYNMLSLAKLKKAKFLFSSTSEIYGDPEVHPQPESYKGSVNPIGKRSCYVQGKRLAETLCFDYLRMYSTDIKVARIFNTYGPRMIPNDGRVVSNFIIQALRGDSLTVYGDGNQTRSFCYVDDLINGLITLMESKHNGPFNLGNDNEFTIIELAEKIINKINTNLRIEFKPLPEDDPLKRKPILKKAFEDLKWAPKIDLDEGLDKTIRFFKEL